MTSEQPPYQQPYQPPQGPIPGQSIPLSAPYYNASFGVAFSRFWRKYATFSGRAGRAEYWWIVLLNLVIGIVVEIVAGVGGMGMSGSQFSNPPVAFATVGVIALLWYLSVIIPSLALGVRRLHDANFSGFMILLSLIPAVGGIIVLIFTLLPPNPAGVRFDR